MIFGKIREGFFSYKPSPNENTAVISPSMLSLSGIEPAFALKSAVMTCQCRVAVIL